jgi:hypothetical protein
MQKTEVFLEDDIDRSTGDVETVRFAFGGTEYEIDLSGQHRKEIAEAFGTYIPHARKAGRLKAPAQPGRRRRDREDKTAIREWAKDRGFELSERGRIPVQVIREYEASH